MDNATTLPTDVPTLHLMLREQQQLIESLKANLHRLLKWRFGPKSEVLDVDQFGLFADGSLVIELPPFEPAAEAKQSASTAPPAERRRAVRVLKSLPRLIEQIDVPEEQKTCPCCGERMSAFGHESSEQLHYIPARLEVHETQRLKYCCGHCHGAVVRAQLPVLPPIPKSMASASPLAYLIVSKFADGLPLYRIAGRLARLARIIRERCDVGTNHTGERDLGRQRQFSMTDRWLIDVYYVHNCCFMPTLACCRRANSSPQVDDECRARLTRCWLRGNRPHRAGDAQPVGEVGKGVRQMQHEVVPTRRTS